MRLLVTTYNVLTIKQSIASYMNNKSEYIDEVNESIKEQNNANIKSYELQKKYFPHVNKSVKMHEEPFKIWLSFFKPHAFQIMILVVLMIALGTVPCMDSLLLKYFVDQATELSQSNTTDFVSQMMIWAIFYGVWWELWNVVWRIYDYTYLKVIPQIKSTVIDNFFEYIQHHSYKFFQHNLAGYITDRIMQAFSASEAIFAKMNEIILRSSISIIVSLITMYYINPIFALIYVTWLIIFSMISIYFSKTIKYYSIKYSQGKATVAGKIVDAISNIIPIRMFAMHRYESRYLKKYTQSVCQRDQDMQWFMFKLRYVLGTLTSGMIVLMVYYLIKLKGDHQITVGDFVAIIGLCNALSGSIWDLVQELGDFFEEFGSFAQSVHLLNTQEILNAKNATTLSVKSGRIVFDSVTFKYKEEKQLFEGKSVIIPAKQHVGLVGFSGSGKTTFVSLINRLYDVNEGQILIDDQNIKLVTQESLHRSISFIPQEPVLFHRTIYENIQYGLEGASKEEIYDAAKKAHIHDVIESLPNKYDTLCGERGSTLSGGQRQRVVIARAILKNAPILILDEATSALDTLTEKNIQASLQYLMQNKTVLVIAHRLSTLLDMDRILVFENGKIVQDGTHSKLLEPGTVYYNLWNSQLKGFI